MNWPAMLASRYVLVPAAVGAVTIAWNIYVAAHNGGMVSGRVVGADGQPVEGATLILYERDLTSSFVERQRGMSGSDGRFRFREHGSHQIRLEVIAPGGTRSPTHTIRLWFRAQNVELAQPLVVTSAAR